MLPAVLFGYTPRDRSVTKVPFWTLCDGGGYGRVPVTQGGSHFGGTVQLGWAGYFSNPLRLGLDGRACPGTTFRCGVLDAWIWQTRPR